MSRKNLASAAFCAAVCVAPVAAEPGFHAPRVFASGCVNFEVSAVAADLDGDGDLDIAVSCEVGFAALKGDGGGRLASPERFGSGTAPRLILADLNGDGALDLVAALPSTDQIAVLPNDGSGRFGPQAAFATGDAPTDLVAGDLDGDLLVDVVTNSFTTNLHLLKGDGAGGLGPPTAIPTGDVPATNLILADFNEDGHPDLAFTRNTRDDVAVLLGDGAGGFSAGGAFPVGRGPVRLLAGDWNGDRHVDLVVANDSVGSLSFLAGDGRGGFAASLVFGSGSLGAGSGIRLVAADFDLDGRLDLAASEPGPDTVVVLRGDGLGGFAPLVELRQRGAYAILTGDFDKDLDADMPILRQNVTMNLGDGQGGFITPPLLPGARLSGIVSRDFDLDGHTDAVVVNRYDHSLTLLRGTGSGSLVAGGSTPLPELSPPLPPQETYSSVQSADFNGDGAADLTVRNDKYGLTYVLLGDGQGGFRIVTSVPESPPHIVDLNEDGRLDLVVPCTVGGVFSTCLRPGDGTGRFGSAQAVAEGYFPSALGDLNLDGHLDIVSWYQRPTDPLPSPDFVFVALNNGQGQFIRLPQEYEIGDQGFSFLIADLDDDGDNDIAVSSSGRSSAESAHLWLLFGDGTGLFGTAVHGAGCVSALKWFDVDVDGHSDIASAFGGMTVCPGDGTGRYEGVLRFGGIGGGPGGDVADFDEDGRPDAAVIMDEAIGGLALFFNRSLPAFPVACSDGIDNDGDDLADFPGDPGCTDPGDGLEVDRFFLSMNSGGLIWDGMRLGLRYDVVRGDLSTLMATRGDFTSATQECVGDDLLSTSLGLQGDPAPGEGFWYLVRGVTMGGNGTYDSDSSSQVGRRDAEINASPTACP